MSIHNIFVGGWTPANEESWKMLKSRQELTVLRNEVEAAKLIGDAYKEKKDRQTAADSKYNKEVGVSKTEEVKWINIGKLQGTYAPGGNETPVKTIAMESPRSKTKTKEKEHEAA
jgi:hypothetical protein